MTHYSDTSAGSMFSERRGEPHQLTLQLMVEPDAGNPAEYRGIFSVCGVELFRGAPAKDRNGAARQAECQFAERLGQLMQQGGHRD